MKVKIKRYHAVANWTWKTPKDDVCGICRVPFDGCCPQCLTPGDDCPIVWGKCTHIFHAHCIENWLSTVGSQGQCPMDRQTFVVAESSITP
ncbi:anaphase-promoting complex subunit Apc11 [Schizosaccharomyces octosporus yFS286]|uniref:Anaphase-promoting complex subunit 11 n=1 Tax=Schizosaccharomyces octosporus (strain yFS286) TaxID=483514 RepID=S9Q5K2_SCHOY|nr:anaphase-promoting complex subunit Apc11 [Schizosaccharomyces octosporus yFS286]EPX74928.1 anaphase-promoting complex subunit Apc11 [Schizosaccharomyces octosporus yFS286]